MWLSGNANGLDVCGSTPFARPALSFIGFLARNLLSAPSRNDRQTVLRHFLYHSRQTAPSLRALIGALATGGPARRKAPVLTRDRLRTLVYALGSSRHRPRAS